MKCAPGPNVVPVVAPHFLTTFTLPREQADDGCREDEQGDQPDRDEASERREVEVRGVDPGA
jgi:hypothetical protein